MFWMNLELLLNCSIFIDMYLTHQNPLSSRNYRIKILGIFSLLLSFMGPTLYFYKIIRTLNGLNITILDRYENYDKPLTNNLFYQIPVGILISYATMAYIFMTTLTYKLYFNRLKISVGDQVHKKFIKNHLLILVFITVRLLSYVMLRVF